MTVVFYAATPNIGAVITQVTVRGSSDQAGDLELSSLVDSSQRS